MHNTKAVIASFLVISTLQLSEIIFIFSKRAISSPHLSTDVASKTLGSNKKITECPLDEWRMALGCEGQVFWLVSGPGSISIALLLPWGEFRTKDEAGRRGDYATE